MEPKESETYSVYARRHEIEMQRVFMAPRFNGKDRHSAAIVAMLKGLIEYKGAYEHVYGSPISTDHVLGAYWETIAHALRGLLNGELGRLDGGLTDRAICEALESAGFNPDVEGERK